MRMMRMVLTPLRVACVVIVVLSSSVSAVAAWRVLRSPGEGLMPPSLPSPVMELTWRPSLLVVGDDYADGYGVVPRNAYPYILCNSVGLNCNVDAETGTGLVNDGREYSSSTNRLVDRIDLDHDLYVVDVLIVDAGRNDVDTSPAICADALDQYLNRVEVLWPGARIYVMAPSYLSPIPYDDYFERVELMSGVTSRYGGTMIDPVAEGWYLNIDVSSIRTGSGAHPSQQGHQLIARELGGILERDGVVPPLPDVSK